MDDTRMTKWACYPNLSRSTAVCYFLDHISTCPLPPFFLVIFPPRINVKINVNIVYCQTLQSLHHLNPLYRTPIAIFFPITTAHQQPICHFRKGSESHAPQRVPGASALPLAKCKLSMETLRNSFRKSTGSKSYLMMDQKRISILLR